YCCWTASWISTNASESRPIDSKVVFGSSTTSLSGRPMRLMRMSLRSLNVNCCATKILLLSNEVVLSSPRTAGLVLLITLCMGKLRPGEGAQIGHLLLGGLAPRGQEQVGQVEVAPAARPEPRRHHHVGPGRVPDAGVQLRQVHHLQQCLQHPRPPLLRW